MSKEIHITETTDETPTDPLPERLVVDFYARISERLLKSPDVAATIADMEKRLEL